MTSTLDLDMILARADTKDIPALVEEIDRLQISRQLAERAHLIELMDLREQLDAIRMDFRIVLGLVDIPADLDDAEFDGAQSEVVLV